MPHPGRVMESREKKVEHKNVLREAIKSRPRKKLKKNRRSSGRRGEG